MSTGQAAAPADYPPARVHIVADDTRGPARPRKAVRTRFGTETVDNTNPVRPLLPDAPDRVCAWVQATGADVYLCDSEGKALQAADTGAADSSELGMFLSHSNTAPWPVGGTQAVWVAQVATGTIASVVSYTADYEA